MHNVKLLTPTRSYVTHYPKAIEFAEQAEQIFWTANEVHVEKDKQDMLVNMSESETHGVITTLKLFTLYELIIGDEYWLGRVKDTFQRPEIQRMCSVFGMYELNVHAPFYSNLNKVLGLDSDEFYLGYVNNPTLKSRIDFIHSVVDDPDMLVSLGAFSMVEGVVLYSSFAFLKHFQTQGKNKLLNVVRGINFSLRDENLHAVAGAWLYRTLRDELKAVGMFDTTHTREAITEAARAIYEHEAKIVDMLFDKGPIDGITPESMKAFIMSRVNLCLGNLNIRPIYTKDETKDDEISRWFYDAINSTSFNDFFSGVGNSYNRNWSQGAFKW